MDKVDLIVQKIEDQKDLIFQKVDDNKRHMDVRLKSIDQNLTLHMKRTEISEARLKHIDDKLSLGGFLKTVGKIIITVGSLSAALIAIAKLFGII